MHPVELILVTELVRERIVLHRKWIWITKFQITLLCFDPPPHVLKLYDIPIPNSHMAMYKKYNDAHSGQQMNNIVISDCFIRNLIFTFNCYYLLVYIEELD